MRNNLSPLFAYHPAGAVGTLFAGPARPQMAREDAKPLVERPGRWARLRSGFRGRWIYQPAPSS